MSMSRSRFLTKQSRRRSELWSAPAERSGDGALVKTTRENPKRCRAALATALHIGASMFEGTVVSINVAPRAEAPMQTVEEARAVPGKGLEGDRYFVRQ